MARNLETFQGRSNIESVLETTAPLTQASAFALDGEATDAGTHVEGWFTFETAIGRGRGLVRLQDGKCWTLLTTLQELKGHEEPEFGGAPRPKGVAAGTHVDRLTWSEQKAKTEQSLGYTEQPYVVIVGGGQGGIALAARLKMLDVPAIVVEKNERAGDSWRKRYRSLCLHDP